MIELPGKINRTWIITIGEEDLTMANGNAATILGSARLGSARLGSAGA